MTDGSAQPQPAPAPPPETPYVGLVPYSEEDAAFFFGRDDETWIVGGNLRASGLTLLYGASGVGKTSLLRAGVIHGLHSHIREKASPHRRRAPFSVCVFAGWSDDPLPALMETIRIAANEALGEDTLPPWQPGDPVADTLRAWTERVRTLLVVLDQFEDYFLYHPDEDGEGTFAGEFPAIVNDPNLRVHFLLSIREDGLAKLDRFKGRIPRLFANYFRVEHLNRHAARDAIEGPVREWNRLQSPSEEPYALEPALVDAVIDSAATGGLALVRSGAGTEVAVDREHIEAPFLQLVMDRLWRATVEGGSRTLTVARLEQLGGAQRIVENHLLDALGALSSDEREVAADLFRFLVTRSKTKIAHPATDLAEWTGRSEPDVTAVLDKLCRGESGRILRRVPPPPTGDGATRYELFHDVLAEPILEWRREYEQARRRRAARRRFVRIGAGLLALVALFATLGIWALIQRSEAQRRSKTATSLALASAATGQLDTNLDKSLLLALEAYRASPGTDAASAAVQALEAARRSGAETIVRGSRDQVRAIALTPDGRTLASADVEGLIRLWDIQERTSLGEPLRGHTGEIWGLAFTPDGRTLASAGRDGRILLWDVGTRTPLGLLREGPGPALTVVFSPDGRLLASGSANGRLDLWDARTGKQLGELRGNTEDIVSVAFSPDGRTLASGGYDETVRLWDVRSRRSLGQLPFREQEVVLSVAFSPDGRTLASAGFDEKVSLWDVRSRRPIGLPLEPRTGEIWSVAFSRDGRTLASAGFEKTVRLWDVRTRTPAGPPLKGHSAAVINVAFGPDGRLVSSGFDGTVRVWDIETTSSLGEPLRGHTARVTSVAFAPEEHVLASAGFDKTVRLWDVAARKVLVRLGNGENADSVEDISISPDGRTLASARVDGAISLWDLETRQRLGDLRGHDGAVHDVEFSPDGLMLASAGFDGTFRLWDVADREQSGEPLRHESPVWAVAFSPDGRTVASSDFDGMLTLWDVDDRRPAAYLPLYGTDIALSLAFSRDGKTLASGGVSGSVRLWDVESRALLGSPLRGHADRVEAVAFSPNGDVFASASDDGTVRLWDASGRRQLGLPLRGHEDAVYSVDFSSDGRTLASGGDDGTVRLWEGILWRDLADLEAQVCNLVVGNLTELEWQELVPGLAYRSTCPS